MRDGEALQLFRCCRYYITLLLLRYMLILRYFFHIIYCLRWYCPRCADAAAELRYYYPLMPLFSLCCHADMFRWRWYYAMLLDIISPIYAMLLLYFCWCFYAMICRHDDPLIADAWYAYFIHLCLRGVIYDDATMLLMTICFWYFQVAAAELS